MNLLSLMMLLGLKKKPVVNYVWKNTTKEQTMNFKTAMKIVFYSEGGLADRPLSEDPGGLTKYGISQRSYPGLDIRNLTIGEAERIYKKDFWDAAKLDELDEWIRLHVFDTAIHAGINRAISILQKIIYADIDGIIGPQTIERTNEIIHPLIRTKIINEYARERMFFYVNLNNFHANRNGWVARVFECSEESFSIVSL